MQTFLPYSSFTQSAAVLDTQRLGNQRNEAMVILLANLRGPKIKLCKACNTRIIRLDYCACCGGSDYKLVTRPWYNHPATKMWRGHEFALFVYIEAILNEWAKRGHMDNVRDDLELVDERYHIRARNYSNPPWLGDEDFHRSHQSNLVRKDPKHYGPLFPNVPNNLPYIWPSVGDQ